MHNLIKNIILSYYKINEGINFSDLDDSDSSDMLGNLSKDRFNQYYIKQLISKLYNYRYNWNKDMDIKENDRNKRAFRKFIKSLKINKPIYKVNNKTINLTIELVIDILGNKANLNWIDTSEVTDMSYLFQFSKFNGQIDKWDVSNVVNMDYMFYGSKFNNDINNWNVNNVITMHSMFCDSKFNKPLNKWNPKNVQDSGFMFYLGNFDQDISNWDFIKTQVEFERTFHDCNISPENLPNINKG